MERYKGLIDEVVLHSAIALPVPAVVLDQLGAEAPPALELPFALLVPLL
jgi:hypothetical protein